VVLAAGLGILMAYFTGGASPAVLFIALVVSGFGNGLFHTPNITAIMSGIPSNRFGVAGGIRSVLFNSSQSIGTAVVLLILGAWFSAAGGDGLSRRVGDPGAVEPGFVVVCALMIVCALGCAAMSARAARFAAAGRTRPAPAPVHDVPDTVDTVGPDPHITQR
jgi:MFS family permease